MRSIGGLPNQRPFFRTVLQEFPLIDATNDTGWKATNTLVAIFLSIFITTMLEFSLGCRFIELYNFL